MAAKVVCFIPCCSAKTASGWLEAYTPIWSHKSPVALKLGAGQQIMNHCIEPSSALTSALQIYQGHFYKALGMKEICQLIHKGELRMFIISAGYGLLDAFEPIHKYDAKMQGSIANQWKKAGLEDVISEVCQVLKPEQIYGFFAGSSQWNYAGAKYRYFYTEGVRKALQGGLRPKRAGCFYRAEGRGTTAILKGLGKCFDDFVCSSYPVDMLAKAKGDGLAYGNVTIKYEEVTTEIKT